MTIIEKTNMLIKSTETYQRLLYLLEKNGIPLSMQRYVYFTFDDFELLKKDFNTDGIIYSNEYDSKVLKLSNLDSDSKDIESFISVETSYKEFFEKVSKLLVEEIGGWKQTIKFEPIIEKDRHGDMVIKGFKFVVNS